MPPAGAPVAMVREQVRELMDKRLFEPVSVDDDVDAQRDRPALEEGHARRRSIATPLDGRRRHGKPRKEFGEQRLGIRVQA